MSEWGLIFTIYGAVGLLVLLVETSIVGATAVMRKDRARRSWPAVHLANYAIFFLSFFHSIGMGTSVPSSSALVALWWAFFILAIAGLIYQKARRLPEFKILLQEAEKFAKPAAAMPK